MGTILDFYNVWDAAFEFFNDKLFDGRLPDVGFTIEKQRMSHAYFHPKQFVDDNGDPLHKISMNEQSLQRTDAETMSTFVHELVHHDQYAHRKPGRGKYHNKEWCQMMMDIGLMPRNHLGKIGLKATGDKVAHDIVDGGPFDEAFKEWEKLDLSLNWKGRKPKPGLTLGADGEERAKTKRKSKTKFTHTCNAHAVPVVKNVWGKPDTLVFCGCGDAYEEA